MSVELRTIMCIRCQHHPAVTWFGYVETAGGHEIAAGWCGKCCDHWHAYYGHHLPEMGIQYTPPPPRDA